MLIKKIVDYQTKYGPRHLVDMISDKEFIEKMKSSISWPDRSYDSAKNQWSFSDKGLTMLKCMPGVVLYEEALSECVDASQYDLPEPYKGIDETINFEKFRRSAIIKKQTSIMRWADVKNLSPQSLQKISSIIKYKETLYETKV